jgi:hypothetical protein
MTAMRPREVGTASPCTTVCLVLRDGEFARYAQVTNPSHQDTAPRILVRATAYLGTATTICDGPWSGSTTT